MKTKILISFVWNEYKKMWDAMLEPSGTILFEIRDCMNARKFLQMDNKTKKYMKKIFISDHK